MKETYLNQTIDQVVTKLTKDANCIQDLYETTCVVSDMEIETKEITNAFWGHEFQAPYFIAIRKMGTEGGWSLDYVKERCAHLGEPVYTYKITYNNDGYFTVVRNIK